MDSLELRRRVPAPVKRALNGALNFADPLLSRRARSAAGKPVPGRVLRARVGEPNAAAFLASGHRVARELEAVLTNAGRPIGTFRSIWDFGAGSGRVLTELAAAPDAVLHAGDVDRHAIAWLAANHPGVVARPNDPLPPAPFDSGSFDLIFAISVFTHLSPSSQDAWLSEVARLLRPGGLAVLTVMGPGLLERYRAGRRPGMTAEQRKLLAAADLEREGVVFAPRQQSRWNRWRHRHTEASYGLTFHHDDYLREHWGRRLEVRAIVPEALNWQQSAVLCAPAGG